MNAEEIIDQITQMTLLYGPKLIGAIAVWIIGGWIIKAIGGAFKSTLNKSKTDPSIRYITKLCWWCDDSYLQTIQSR